MFIGIYILFSIVSIFLRDWQNCPPPVALELSYQFKKNRYSHTSFPSLISKKYQDIIEPHLPCKEGVLTT